MDWLTKELTSIERVRRNVVGLAAVSMLLVFFPIRASDITLLGAHFTSDVVAFALFHTLVFYVLTLAVRSFIHGRLGDFQRTHFEGDVERLMHPLRAEAEQIDERVRGAFERLSLAEQQSGDRIREIVELRNEKFEQYSRLGHDNLLAFEKLTDPNQSKQERARAKAEVERITELRDKVISEVVSFDETRRAEQLKVSPMREDFWSAQKAKAGITRRIALIEKQMPFASFVHAYVFVGEFLFPIGFGFAAALFLFQTHTFPMLWDLHLNVQR